MKTFFAVTLTVVLLAGGVGVLRFGTALIQEGNPLPVLFAIMQLELSNSSYESFSETAKRKRYVSENTGEARHNTITSFMKEKNWRFGEQMGAGLIFEKNDQTVVVETRQYSKNYIVWEVPREAFN